MGCPLGTSGHDSVVGCIAQMKTAEAREEVAEAADDPV
jgi:hypothetical protein